MFTGICAGRATFSSAKNYMPQGAKGELYLVGYDGETIVFVEIRNPNRTSTVREDISGLPELSVSYAKQSVLVRAAHVS
jgi:Holliday junction resolvase-like predicted endonuclease